jgi:hypothetical protein
MSRSAGASSSSPSLELPNARAACAGEEARQERRSALTVVLLRKHSACSKRHNGNRFMQRAAAKQLACPPEGASQCQRCNRC